jgi:hypothetical protein
MINRPKQNNKFALLHFTIFYDCILGPSEWLINSNKHLPSMRRKKSWNWLGTSLQNRAELFFFSFFFFADLSLTILETTRRLTSNTQCLYLGSYESLHNHSPLRRALAHSTSNMASSRLFASLHHGYPEIKVTVVIEDRCDVNSCVATDLGGERDLSSSHGSGMVRTMAIESSNVEQHQLGGPLKEDRSRYTGERYPQMILAPTFVRPTKEMPDRYPRFVQTSYFYDKMKLDKLIGSASNAFAQHDEADEAIDISG